MDCPATPNPWPDKDAWPSDSDVERWVEAGAPTSADVARKISALLEGENLDPDTVLLGAVLRIPTYRRDLEFRFWLTASGAETLSRNVISSIPTGRTLASWLAGWSFAASQPPGVTSVQFAGTLVNYPNSELDVTPTDQWSREWKWVPDPQNALRFRSPNGAPAAWHERWLGPDTPARRTHRQPLLSRWIAMQECLPSEFDDLSGWTRSTEMLSGMLSRPE